MPKWFSRMVETGPQAPLVRTFSAVTLITVTVTTGERLRKAMDERNNQKKRKVQTKLRGERPPGVVGRMKPRQLIELIERMKREHTLEEEERTWKELDRILREDPV